jgi:hypothetical protein
MTAQHLNLSHLRDLDHVVDVIRDSAAEAFFAPFAGTPRWQGIEDAWFRPGQRISYRNEVIPAAQVDAWALEHPVEDKVLHFLRNALLVIKLEGDKEFDELRWYVMRAIGTADDQVIERFYVRIEIEWQGAEMVREYSLYPTREASS